MVFSHYSAAAVRLEHRIAGRAVLARKGLLRSPVKPDLPELAEIGRHRLYAGSPELAGELEPLGEWLARRGCHFEIVHDHVLAYDRRRLLTPRAALIEAADGLAGRLPHAGTAVPLRRAA